MFDFEDDPRWIKFKRESEARKKLAALPIGSDESRSAGCSCINTEPAGRDEKCKLHGLSLGEASERRARKVLEGRISKCLNDILERQQAIEVDAVAEYIADYITKEVQKENERITVEMAAVREKNNSFLKRRGERAETAIEKLSTELRKRDKRDAGLITIECTWKWDNEKQQYTDELQYQLLTYWNQEDCAPAANISEACENARTAIADEDIRRGRNF